MPDARKDLASVSLDTLYSARAHSRMYTRVYLGGSVRQLASGKGLSDNPLSRTALLEEFKIYARWIQEPTALVSASDRIVDTLKRALDMYHEDHNPAEIWIAFIEIPPTTKEITTRKHSAKELAEECKIPEPNKFSHEVVFEWAIPEKYVVHKVSLQTLLQRGLHEQCFPQDMSTADIRRGFARGFQLQDPFDIGLSLGIFARNFGAYAPLNWISHQLFHDCVWVQIVVDDVVRLPFTHGCTETVDFRFFADLDEGINTSLYEWWLSDPDFQLDYEEFDEWRGVAEDSITWDLIEFWEAWHDVERDGTIVELSANEKNVYESEKNNLLAEHERKRTDIEAKAVKLGL